MSQNKKIQQNQQIPQPKKVPLLWFLHHHSTPRGSTTAISSRFSRTLICACMLAPARDGKFAKAAKVSWNPGNRRVSLCWLLREGGRFLHHETLGCEIDSVQLKLFVKNIQVKSSSIYLEHKKKSGWTIPNSVKCDCSQPAGIIPPRGVASVAAFATKKVNNSTFPSHHFISSQKSQGCRFGRLKPKPSFTPGFTNLDLDRGGMESHLWRGLVSENVSG